MDTDLGKKGEIVGEIIFAGDSFVFGEGIDYESNCPIIKDIIKWEDESLSLIHI
mgnify:FL=1